jgi:replicative DNA helicase
MQPFKLSTSKEFQEELFAFLITEDGYREFGQFVQEEAFTLEYLALAWLEAREFYRAYRTVPTNGSLIEAVVKGLPDGKRLKALTENLRRVMEIKPGNETFIRNTLVQYVRRVRLSQLAEQLIVSAEMNDMEDPMIVRSKLDEALTFGIPTTDSSFFKEARDRLLHYISGDTEEYINVGLGRNIQVARGELGVIMGPPKRGKTLSLVNIGYGAMCNGYKVLHITLELRKRPTELRYDRAITALTKRAIRTAENHERALDVIGRLQRLRGDLVVEYFSAGSIGIDHIYGMLNLYRSQGRNFDVLVVDYADLLRPEKHYDDRRYELSANYTRLRSIAAEFDMAAWTATQSQRHTLNAEVITMEDVAEDIGKMAIADLIVAFCQTMEERKSNPERARLFVAGGREEEDAKMCPCRVDRDIARIFVEDL